MGNAVEPIESIKALKKTAAPLSIDTFFKAQKDSVEQGKHISMYAIAVLSSDTVQRNLQPRIEHSFLTAENSKKSQARIFKQLQTEYQNLNEKSQKFKEDGVWYKRAVNLVSKGSTVSSIGTFAYAAASASNPFTAAGLVLLAAIQSTNLMEGWDKAANPLSQLFGISREKIKTGLEYIFGYLPSIVTNASFLKGFLPFNLPEIALPSNPFGAPLAVVKMTTTYFDSKRIDKWEVYQLGSQGRMTKLKDKQTQVGEKLKTAGSASSEFRKSRDSFHVSSEMLDRLRK